MNAQVTLSLAATGWTPWIRLIEIDNVSLQVTVPQTGSPVGAFSLEFSNDLFAIDAERAAGVAPANSAAVVFQFPVDILQVTGAVWATGFDGAADRSSYVTIWPCPGALRIKWTKTSGTGTATVYLVGR